MILFSWFFTSHSGKNKELQVLIAGKNTDPHSFAYAKLNVGAEGNYRQANQMKIRNCRKE
jgi:hypothetical protein